MIEVCLKAQIKDFTYRRGKIVMTKKRDYYRYELKQGNKIVYVGISNAPSRREAEHASDDKKFSNMKIVGPAVTEESARKWEQERLEQYRQAHGGGNPKYNKE